MSCKDCIYKRRLIHNFIPNEGWGEDLCCTVFLSDGGPVYETTADDTCEHFAESETKVIEVNIYDVEEVHDNCVVQILKNTVTGDMSVGWWEKEE